MTIMAITWVLLLALGFPIAYALGMASLAYFLTAHPELLPVLPQRVFAGLHSYALIALPLFMFMGQIMNSTGITRRLVDLCLLLVGRLPGGLGMVNVISSMLFGGISGSSTSDTASIGSVLIPEMKKRGYPLHHASGITVASSTMGMVLPPSIPMVIFAIAGQVSIGRLFLGGILPGLIVGVLQLAAVAWMASRNHYPREEHPPSWSASGVLLMRSMHVLLMPILLVGSIVFGIATATESAAIGALYAVAIGGLVHRELTWKKCLDALTQSARLSAQIMMIIAFSQVFVWMLALERTPQALAEGLMALNLSPSMLLLIIVALVLIMGTVIDVSPGILLLTPIFMPVVAQAGISPVWFGVVFVGALAVGACTPPVGTCLNVCAAISGQSIGTIFRGALPFLAANAIMLLLVILFPELVLFLPDWLMPAS